MSRGGGGVLEVVLDRGGIKGHWKGRRKLWIYISKKHTEQVNRDIRDRVTNLQVVRKLTTGNPVQR